MNANRKFFIAAGASALVLAAGSAAFADEPVFGGTTGSAPVSTTTPTGTHTTTTGSESVAPYTAVTTTVQSQTVNSTTAPTVTGVSNTIGGTTYTGNITVSGTGSQNQTQTSTLTQVYNPGPPPTPNGPPVIVTNPAVNVGAATITAISATGSVGTLATPSFGAVLSSGGFISPTAVSATENDVYQSASGVTYSTYVGSATYDPSTGNVKVLLPTSATSSTSIGSGGISTSGTVSASTVSATTVSAGTVFADTVSAGQVNTNYLALTPSNPGDTVIDAGGGRISNLANGTAPGDAVNLYQLQAGLNNYRKQAASGTAVAAAMSGAYFLPGKKFSITGNLSDYLGEGAFAFNLGYMVTPNIAINAAVASAFSYGGTAGRIGATYGF